MSEPRKRYRELIRFREDKWSQEDWRSREDGERLDDRRSFVGDD